MTYTIYTYPGNPRVIKILIAAQYNNVDITIAKNFEMCKDNKSIEFLQKNPLGKVPVMDTPEGSLFESTAIARYIARLRNDTKLYGKTFYESGQVDQWIDYCTHEVDVPISMWLMPILGYMPYNPESTEKAKKDVHYALDIVEKHLMTRTYMVGEQITLADIVLFSTLFYPFKMLFDKEYRKQFTNLQRWFVTLANQEEFSSVVGDVPLCQIAQVPEGQTASSGSGNNKKDKKEKSKKKEQSKPAAKKEEKKDAVEEEEKPKKKPEHPLAILNREKPSSMVLDTWKVQYSNTKPLSKAMEWFWENLDQQGYSLWFCNYNYNKENTKVFMTCNAVSGFLQRSEAMRKYAFGVMDVIGEEGKEIKITGCWLFRGDTEKHMIEANPDAEYYTWTKVTKLDEKAKKEITAYWINEDELQGMPILDSKVFK